MQRVVISILILFLHHCAFEGNANSDENTEQLEKQQIIAALEVKEQQIKEMVADQSCQTDHDCASIGYSAKICGGYSGYLVFSTIKTDTNSLEAERDEHFKLGKRFIELSPGLTGTCDWATEPAVSCESNLCTCTGHYCLTP